MTAGEGAVKGIIAEAMVNAGTMAAKATEGQVIVRGGVPEEWLDVSFYFLFVTG